MSQSSNPSNPSISPEAQPAPSPQQGQTMYITFYDSRKDHVGHQYSIYDYVGAMQAANDPLSLSADTTQVKKLTVNRSKEGLRSFFVHHSAHKQWKALPDLPDFPIEEIDKHYTTYMIPKADGGKRRIDAPDEALKDYLKEMKRYFEKVLCILPSEAAHAYVSGRGCITSVKVHQDAKNQNWFLKLDLHGFFPSHNLAYIMQMLEHIYPIGFLMEDPTYKENLELHLKYALLNDSLPQGSNLSPTLSNILMVPLDYHIQRNLWAMDKGYIYTRYADDMLISSPYKTDYTEVERMIEEVIASVHAPFELNTKKTRYGNKAGENWNLGVMLNKDNEITYGWKNVKAFRAKIFSLCKDYSNKIEWTIAQKQELRGIISWYKSVNRKRTELIIKEYETKFNVNVSKLLKPPK